MLRCWGTILLLALVGCDHEYPPEPVIGVIDSSPIAGPPVRLTLNPGADFAASFTADGQGLWYTWERLESPAHAFCLGLIPITGGTRRQELCSTVARQHPDSTDWYLWPAIDASARHLVWYYSWTFRAAYKTYPFNGLLAAADVASNGDVGPMDTLHVMPFQVAPGLEHNHPQPERLTWVDDSTLLYLAILPAAEFDQDLPTDTIRSGIEIGRIIIGAAGVTLGYLPGTAEASGFDLHSDGTVYFTRNGVAGVYRTRLDDPTIDTVFDASGVAAIARDAVVRDTIAYLILKGPVVYTFLQDIGFVQSDAGGELWKVTPGTATLLEGTKLWRRPILSPDGHYLVVEGRLTTSDKSDLYRIRID